MDPVDQLLTAVSTGRDVSVRKTSTMERTIVITDKSSRAEEKITLRRDHYETVMAVFADRLCDADGKGLKVSISMDFYGRQALVVRSGLLGRRASQLLLSPRHVATIQDGLTKRALLATAEC